MMASMRRQQMLFAQLAAGSSKGRGNHDALPRENCGAFFTVDVVYNQLFTST
jgi:hypothetical protein